MSRRPPVTPAPRSASSGDTLPAVKAGATTAITVSTTASSTVSRAGPIGRPGAGVAGPKGATTRGTGGPAPSAGSTPATPVTNPGSAPSTPRGQGVPPR